MLFVFLIQRYTLLGTQPDLHKRDLRRVVVVLMVVPDIYEFHYNSRVEWMDVLWGKKCTNKRIVRGPKAGQGPGARGDCPRICGIPHNHPKGREALCGKIQGIGRHTYILVGRFQGMRTRAAVFADTNADDYMVGAIWGAARSTLQGRK